MHKCKKCGRELNTAKGLSIHETRVHPYRPPVPPYVPPVRKHVNFEDLVYPGHNWGRNMTEAEKKSPDMASLQLGATLRLITLLEKVLIQLHGRP